MNIQSLLYNDIADKIDEINEIKGVILKRNILEIKNFYEKYIEKDGNVNEFKLEKENYFDIKNNINRNINKIKDNIKSLSDSYVSDMEQKQKIDECIKDTEKYLKDINQTLDKIIKIDNFINSNGINIEEENNNSNIYNSNIQEKLGIKLDAVQLANNKEFLKNREKELTEINKLSQNIKQASDSMKEDVNKQSEDLNLISDKVNEMEKNVDKAEEQIKKAKNLEKKTNRKLFCIIIIIVIAIIIISGLLGIIIFK